MKKNPDRLYDLLPLIYRQQDVEQGWPLKALLRVAAEQLHIVEEDIDRLYQNWFIETCDDWVVPYIAELVGYEPVHEAGQPGEVKTRQGQRRNKILIPRRDVANTIRNRRRKGTLALLEELARDVADWPARAVEFFTLLSVTQSINHLHLQRGRTADLSDDDALSRLNGPFDEMAHTVDIRRPNSQRTHGRYNIPSIGLFVWRLRSFPVTKTQAYLVESKGASLCYTFSALNNDIQLFTHVTPESDATQIAAELDLPVPIRRQALQKNRDFYYGEGKSLQIWKDIPPNAPVPADKIVVADLSAWVYSPKENDQVIVDPQMGRIVLAGGIEPENGIWVSYHYGFSAEIGGGEYSRPLFQPAVPSVENVLFQAGDFAKPEKMAAKLRKARDPLSRFVKQCCSEKVQKMLQEAEGEQAAPEELHTALLDDFNRILQGECIFEKIRFEKVPLTSDVQNLLKLQPTTEERVFLNRKLLEAGFPNELNPLFKVYLVGRDEQYEHKSISAALGQWQTDMPRHAVIEIRDNGIYTEPIEIYLKAYQTLQIRAANRTRPIIRLVDLRPGRSDTIRIQGEKRSRFTLDGLLIMGRGLTVEGVQQSQNTNASECDDEPGDLDELNIRHCTLVPGWSIDADCEPIDPDKKSLVLRNTTARVSISDSIVGTILVDIDAVKFDPIRIQISDSILDSTQHDDEALTAPGQSECPHAHAILTIKRSTVIGKICTHAMELAENSIFNNLIGVARRQLGCMRFCYVDPDARTPKRYHCQPDLVLREKKLELGIALILAQEDIPEEMRNALQAEANRVQPHFVELRYGKAEYGRLTDNTAEEIKRGADDESEMGVFHDLFQPQREANLRTRLEEYTPAGMNAGIIFAN